MEALSENNLANDVAVAHDGADALDYLYRRGIHANRIPGNPAMVLLDLKMPKVDGLEVLRVLKSDPNLNTVPVVLLTSSREDRDLTEAYRLGVNAYVVKPVGFGPFLESVRQVGVFWALINEPPIGSRKAR